MHAHSNSHLSLPTGLFVRIPRCHINLPYYAGFALIMSRRFDEALRLLSRTLLFFHRTSRILDEVRACVRGCVCVVVAGC